MRARHDGLVPDGAPVRIAMVLLLAGTAVPAHAQRDALVRADRIRTFDPAQLGGRVNPVWLSDGVRFYHEATAGADRGVLFLVDPVRRTRHPLFDNARIAASLSAAARVQIDTLRLPPVRGG